MTWRVDSTPDLVIGVAEGPEPYLFTDISGALRQRDGTIVIADRRTRQLRFFDADGQFIKAIGGAGQGPGEFQEGVAYHPTLYHGNGDSLVVRDTYRNVALLEPSGSFIRRQRIAARDTVPDAVGDLARLSLVFGDGSYLVLDQTDVCPALRGPAGPCETQMVFRRVSDGGSTLAAFGRLVSHRFEMAKSRGMVRSFSQFQSLPYWGVYGTDFYHGDSRTFEFRKFGADGRLSRIVRAALAQATPDQLPPPEWVTAQVHSVPLPGAPNAAALEAFQREAWASAQRPARLRAYDGLIVDRVGNVWIREYLVGRPPPPTGERWWVFDSTGTLRHGVRLPSVIGRAFESVQRQHWPQPVFIDDDIVLAVSSDADRVPRVNVYKIRKVSVRAGAASP